MSAFELEKLVADIIARTMDPELQEFKHLKSRMANLKTLHTEAERTDDWSTEYIDARNEVAELLMPLMTELVDLEMLTTVNTKPQSSVVDSLGQPFVNGGIMLMTMPKIWWFLLP